MEGGGVFFVTAEAIKPELP